MSSQQSVPSRRDIVRGIGGAVAVGAIGTTPTVVSADHYDLPHIEIRDGCLQAHVEYDPEPDSVALHLQDGTAHEFTTFDRETGGDFGYGGARNDGQVQGWHGSIERVEVQSGNRTVLVDATDCPSTDVTCSFFESDMEFADLRMQYDTAYKDYGRLPSNARGGSPGRAVTQIGDNYLELLIELDGECDPDEDPAVEFDCTSVTLHDSEFSARDDGFYGAVLHFADGTTETIRDVDEAFEPPETSETYAGSGEHDGKVIQRFTIGQPGDLYFQFDNPDADTCEPADATADGDSDGEGDGGDGEPADEDSDSQDEDGSTEEEAAAERSLELTTSADLAEYTLTVEGDAEPGDGSDTWPHEYQDTVDCGGGTCEIHGYVAAGGTDDYAIRGEIVSAGSDEPVTVTLDGESMPIGALGDGAASIGPRISGGGGAVEWFVKRLKPLLR